jgi:hypothetical protein
MAQCSIARGARGRSRLDREDSPHLSAMQPVTPASRVV